MLTDSDCASPSTSRPRGPEGCLSFDSIAEVLRAPTQLVLRARNLRGQPFEMMLMDKHARAVAHECEHLRGRTMLDRMSQPKRKMFLQAVQNRREKLARTAHVGGSLRGPHTAA